MPANCLDNIISIKSNCGENKPSLSGFDLFDLPGISLAKMSAIADADYITGVALARDKVRLATLKIRGDLMQFLQGNGYMINQIDGLFRSGEANDMQAIPAINSGGWRGQVIYNKRHDCTLRKLFISEVYLTTNFSGMSVLRIQDGANNYDYDVELIAGALQAVTINFECESSEVKILLPDTIPVYPVKPNCGCGGSASDCAKTLGYSGLTTNNSESFGVFADVQCKCNFDFLLCQMASVGTFGEMLMYLSGAMVLDEAMKTDRLNWFTIYGVDESKATRAEWLAEYGEKYNSLIASLPTMLQNMDNCGCLRCGGSYIAANV